MSTLITTTASWDELRAPENTEEGDAGDLIVTTIQPLGNRTHLLNQNLTATSRVLMPGERRVELSGRFDVSSGWSLGFLNKPYLAQTNLDASRVLRFPINHLLPSNGRIRRIQAVVFGEPTNRPGNNLPATMPMIGLYRVSRDAMPSTSADAVTTALDHSASQLAYVLPHYLYADMTHSVDLSYNYHVAITGEAGADSFLGFCVIDLSVTVEATP